MQKPYYYSNQSQEDDEMGDDDGEYETNETYGHDNDENYYGKCKCAYHWLNA